MIGRKIEISLGVVISTSMNMEKEIKTLKDEIQKRDEVLDQIHVSHDALIEYVSDLETYIWEQKDQKLGKDIEAIFDDYCISQTDFMDEINFISYVIVLEIGVLIGMLFMWYLRQ